MNPWSAMVIMLVFYLFYFFFRMGLNLGVAGRLADQGVKRYLGFELNAFRIFG